MILKSIPLFVLLLPAIRSTSQQDLPLFQISDMQYIGAFRLPASTFGNSDLNYSQGPIEYNSVNHSLFIVGHDHRQAIAEFSIPVLVNGPLEQLNMGSDLQPFVSHLNAVHCGNTQNINKVGGMKLVNGRLFVNAYEYYDADANVTNTTLIIENPSQLSTSNVSGYYDLEGGGGHTSGWISRVPQVWQNLLGGTHITGQSSGIPIISRCSVGPSAFCFSPELLDPDCANEISTIKLLDFSLNNPLHADLSNDTGSNDLWTHLSRATFGLIVPQTRTYLTIGYSGGHASGVCYKCTQDNGQECGGYCAPLTSDYNQYYWLWDINDLLSVKSGLIQSYEVLPYDYGVFNTPHGQNTNEIGGGAFDPLSGTLYLTVQKADYDQGTYANPPVVVAYQISNPDCSNCCESEVYITTNDIYSDMQIHSQNFIQSNAVVDGFFNLQWNAMSFVEILPEFEITAGSDLTIRMINCTEE